MDLHQRLFDFAARPVPEFQWSRQITAAQVAQEQPQLHAVAEDANYGCKASRQTQQRCRRQAIGLRGFNLLVQLIIAYKLCQYSMRPLAIDRTTEDTRIPLWLEQTGLHAPFICCLRLVSLFENVLWSSEPDAVSFRQSLDLEQGATRHPICYYTAAAANLVFFPMLFRAAINVQELSSLLTSLSLMANWWLPHKGILTAVFGSYQRWWREPVRQHYQTICQSLPSPISDAISCPITKNAMGQPVLADSGHSFEASALDAWLQEHSSNPYTQETLLAHRPNLRLTMGIHWLLTGKGSDQWARCDRSKALLVGSFFTHLANGETVLTTQLTEQEQQGFIRDFALQALVTACIEDGRLTP